jgi:hypothetical protein
MEEFNPKEPSKGLGDTIAKFTNATGIAKLVESDNCGSRYRRLWV